MKLYDYTGKAYELNTETDKTLTEENVPADAEAVGLAFNSIGMSIIEPDSVDVPRIYITGTLPTTKEQGELPVILTYKSRTNEFTSYATLKVQGDSTTMFPKKNFTIKLFSDSSRTVKDKHAFKNWSSYNKFVIKANWLDITHARNVVCAKIWYDMVKSRSDYNNLPTELLESDHLACIDGFPITMYANGQYYGRYAFNLTKDNMLNMDEDNPDHAMVQGQGYDDGTAFKGTSVQYWSDELTDDLTHVQPRWVDILSFVSTSSDADFKANLKNYFSIPSLIDFYLFGTAFLAWDSYGKNQSYLTYDGSYFICSAYDMDNTIGLYWTGTMPFSPTVEWFPYNRITSEGVVSGDNVNNLYKRLATLFNAEIVARWAELRQHGGALSFENIDKHFADWCSLATIEQMKEDYASTTAGGAFTDMANIAGGNATSNNLQQIINFMHDRLVRFDALIV